MTTHTEKLIQDGLWRDISEAPMDGTIYLGEIIQPDGSFGQPFEAHFDEDIGKHVCVFQTEPVHHMPTHFRPFPDDRCANAFKVAVEALRIISKWHEYPVQAGAEIAAMNMQRCALEALTEIERIACNIENNKS